MHGDAFFSEDGVYRWSLTRDWSGDGGHALFVLLNPSTADALQDDPTIRRCIGYARDWGCGGMTVANIFALRATNPKRLAAHVDPVGAMNDDMLRMQIARRDVRIRVAAWGTHGALRGRQQQVLDLFDGWPLFVLGLTKQGFPKHPLYLRKDLKPQMWAYRRDSA